MPLPAEELQKRLFYVHQQARTVLDRAFDRFGIFPSASGTGHGTGEDTDRRTDA